MKLNVLIPSRGRPYQLAAALYSLFLCASGEHQIQFCVACDEDDEATKNALQALRSEMPLFVRIGPRPDSLGSVSNDLAEHWPAEAYVIFADDLLCVSYGWDKAVAKAVEETPHGVFWWTPASELRTFVPIVTEKWRKAAGCIFTEHFPFWYDDMWLHEVWIMATDSAPLVLDIHLVDKPKSTQQMRELRFWHDFYHFMRGERIRRGKEIATALGLREPIVGPFIAPQLSEAGQVTDEFLEDIQVRNKAETGEPSEVYKRAKVRAEELMRKAA